MPVVYPQMVGMNQPKYNHFLRFTSGGNGRGRGRKEKETYPSPPKNEKICQKQKSIKCRNFFCGWQLGEIKCVGNAGLSTNTGCCLSLSQFVIIPRSDHLQVQEQRLADQPFRHSLAGVNLPPCGDELQLIRIRNIGFYQLWKGRFFSKPPISFQTLYEWKKRIKVH